MVQWSGDTTSIYRLQVGWLKSTNCNLELIIFFELHSVALCVSINSSLYILFINHNIQSYILYYNN